MMSRGWIGVDLDGTLAVQDENAPWDPLVIGPPIPRMVKRIKAHLARGTEVRILTARGSGKDESPELKLAIKEAIKKWCLKHLGVSLRVTHSKDYAMILLYDDRAVRVERNTGRLL